MKLISYRADTFLRRGTGDVSMIEESQNLSLFLANQNKITFLLKEGLETIQGYEDVLADVLSLSARLHEGNMYITPNEKHVLLKVSCSGASLEVGNWRKLHPTLSEFTSHHCLVCPDFY